MNTDKDNVELKQQALIAVLNNVGRLIEIYLSDADFKSIRELKGNIDRLFTEAEKAVQRSKVSKN
ncbi:MAG TPA: hypothetical protein PK874_12375 [Desulfobacteraceae bacterium]|nr:hypothetical protein [Desulfobacteraceae bacterium]HPQ28621.1 hypothetical protein [Desulfobacteraceae bacterium]